MSPHIKYLRYVVRHKWFVFVAGVKLGAPLWRLIIHDWSKFTPGEWFAYVDYFYGERERLKREEPDDFRYAIAAGPYVVAFDRAWLHHQHANKHHWQHWVLREDDGNTKIVEMPEKYIREMVADWMGAGRAITGKWEALAWYEKNASRIMLTQNTRLCVETLLKFGRMP